MLANIRLAGGALFSAALGAWLFRANLTTDDTGIMAGLILIGSAAAALILPSRWSPLAALIGVCVVLSELYRSRGEIGVGFLVAVLLILGFSIVGIGAAAGARRLWGGSSA